MTENMIRLASTLRGLPLVAYPPSARYYRTHTISLAPEVTETPVAAIRVQAATATCSESRTWASRDTGSYVDPTIRIFERDGELVLVSQVLGLDVSLASSPEAQALRAEVSALDHAWSKVNEAVLVREDARTLATARTAVQNETGRDPAALPVETECLECGATYSAPGSVEPGGMSCRRCR